MDSLIISKYNPELDYPVFIDLGKYRNYIDSAFNYNWMEDVDNIYATIQKDREEGKRTDKIKSRFQLDFYYNYVANTRGCDFDGCYFDSFGYLYISFDPKYITNIYKEIFLLAQNIDAFVFDKKTKLDIDYFVNYKINTKKNRKNNNKDISHILENNLSSMTLIMELYPCKKNNFFKSLFSRFQKIKYLEIHSWDYSISSLNNLKFIIQNDVNEGAPKYSSSLSKLGLSYGEAFKYYIGEVIIRSTSSYYWNYIEIEGEYILGIINKPGTKFILPGTFLLNLLASNGHFDIISDVKYEIAK